MESFDGNSVSQPFASRVTLLCPVRGCGAALVRDERRLVCSSGHSFDLARSGYANLLQPQDRRSATPGDSRAAALARRRLYGAGHGRPLLEELARQLDEIAGRRGAAAAAAGGPERDAPPALLDVGCGEGTLLGELAAARPLEGHGVDISTPAIELAARRYPGVAWVVANADRCLPYAAASFAAVVALSSRLQPQELQRVLAPGGRLIVAVPAADDLVELREALLGVAQERDRLARAAGVLAPAFTLEATTTVRHRATLDSAAIQDVLAATYRGARRSQQERLATLGPLPVTMSFAVGRFRLAYPE